MFEQVAGASILTKLGIASVVGVLGALIMAAVDPPQTRREMFLQAVTAGVGSMLFGGPALRVLDYYVDAIDLTHATIGQYIESGVPVYFLIGAFSWGAFGALAKFRKIVREDAAAAIWKRISGRDNPAPKE